VCIVLVSEPLPARHFPSIATVANQQATRLPLAPVEKSIHHHFNFALTPVWPRIRWGVQIVACSLDCGSRASIIPLPAALRLAVRLRHSSAGTRERPSKAFIPWASSLFCCICILPYLFLPSSHPLGPLWILYFFLLSFDGKDSLGFAPTICMTRHCLHHKYPSYPQQDPVTRPGIEPALTFPRPRLCPCCQPRPPAQLYQDTSFRRPVDVVVFCLLRSCTPHSPTALSIVQQSTQRPSTLKVNVIPFSSDNSLRPFRNRSCAAHPGPSRRRFALSGNCRDGPSPNELLLSAPRDSSVPFCAGMRSTHLRP
jgi:hypothetical protein